MIWALIQKDLRRLRVNWHSTVILLAMPLCITGLVGAVFGPAARNNEMPRIKLAVVDEDDSVLGGMLAGAGSSERGRDSLDTVVVDREEADKLIRNNEVSAIIVIPKDFTSMFLKGEHPPPIELIKNPAQSYLPAITEELMCVVTELLNALALNLADEVPDIVEIFEQDGGPDSAKLARSITRIGDKLERAEAYVFPPIISYTKNAPKDTDSSVVDGTDSEATVQEDSGPTFNIFGFVIPGMAAIFLLMTAEGSTRELIVERRSGTLDRYRTCHAKLLPLFVAKSIFSLVVVIASGLIILVGGSLIFDITWTRPVECMLLTVAFSLFSVGFTYLLIAVVYREKLILAMNTVVIMLMGFLGGSMMPVQSLPGIIRDVISPALPNYMYVEAFRSLQNGHSDASWIGISIGLCLGGFVLLVAAIAIFQRRLLRGATT